MVGVSIARFSLLYREVLITVNWLPSFVRGSWPRMSIKIISSRPVGRNCCNWRFRSNVVPIRGQSWQWRTVLYTSAEDFGQKYSRLNVSYIQGSPRWPESVKWCTKYQMKGLMDCDTTFCTEPYMSEHLTQSPFLSELKDAQGVSEMGKMLLQYASLRCEFVQLCTVASYGLFFSIWGRSVVLSWNSLSLFCAHVATAINAISSLMQNHPSPLWEILIMVQLPGVWRQP